MLRIKSKKMQSMSLFFVERGINTYLLSGDKKNVAEYLASVVGISLRRCCDFVIVAWCTSSSCGVKSQEEEQLISNTQQQWGWRVVKAVVLGLYGLAMSYAMG